MLLHRVSSPLRFGLLALFLLVPPAEAREASSVRETDIPALRDYAVVACLTAAYRQGGPAMTETVATLEKEQWAIVEETGAGPETYASLHAAASAHGRGLPAPAAVRGCLHWGESEAVRRRLPNRGK